MNDILRAEGLSKKFNGIQAVSNVSFKVDQEEVFGFLGPNGAGKTTTVRMMTGVLEPDSGTAWINGKDIQKKPIKAKEEVGIAPEISNAYVDLTAWQNMMLMGELFGVPKEKRKKRAKQLLELFQLSDRKNTKVKGFSKGMQKRLILSMAMIKDPPILFFDEPTTGLDVQSRRLIKKRIRDLNKKGKAIFLTTHDMEVANDLCDRIAVIHNGKIVAIDTPEKLKEKIKEKRALEICFEERNPPIELENIEKVEKVEKRGDKCRIFTSDPITVLNHCLALADEKELEIVSICTLGPSLEDVFIDLTGGK
ncbi:MAG: ABC-type multidrug transport system, ATPase component CcmA [Candidatus Methanohalarchaeum thermophilum]|uniref:ABC-type multidrug transport system, ATPase component CcmA n=1 Tax=Methanohalarchaeum thermophilum TaxID=1903181 RepID=A0A1Q6DXM7_METT1|nr:MAG: ABC-type multidrug transport system, ATPase component CcmA [Candidatus Methanohalarchaeum thermophilum]